MEWNFETSLRSFPTSLFPPGGSRGFLNSAPHHGSCDSAQHHAMWHVPRSHMLPAGYTTSITSPVSSWVGSAGILRSPCLSSSSRRGPSSRPSSRLRPDHSSRSRRAGVDPTARARVARRANSYIIRCHVSDPPVPAVSSCRLPLAWPAHAAVLARLTPEPLTPESLDFMAGSQGVIGPHGGICLLTASASCRGQSPPSSCTRRRRWGPSARPRSLARRRRRGP